MLGVGGLARVAAGATFAVGTFTKTTSGAPVTQAVAHGLGQAPKALILWTNGKTSTTLGASFLFAFGMTDGSTDKSVAAASADNVGTSSGNRRIASKALTIIDSAGTLQAEADLQSFDSTDFTLDWTTNNGTAYVIHYLAIAGPAVSAKVLGWTMATATGDQSVTGVGFKPEVVIHAHGGAGLTGGAPTTASNAAFGLSVMDAAGSQWANSAFSTDGQGASDTSRNQRTDRCLLAASIIQTNLKDATWVSMDTDGFTINYSTANSYAGQMISLALKGVQAQAGSFSKATGGAPASQVVTGVRFKPMAVLLTSVQNTASTAVATHARFGLGATDATTEGAVAFQDADALSTTSVDGVSRTTKAFIKVDNDTRTVDAEADTTSFDASGFTLSWSTNDAVATEVLYLALANRRRMMIVGRRRPQDPMTRSTWIRPRLRR